MLIQDFPTPAILDWGPADRRPMQKQPSRRHPEPLYYVEV